MDATFAMGRRVRLVRWVRLVRRVGYLRWCDSATCATVRFIEFFIVFGMKIRKHTDLKVYQLSFEAGMEIFELSKKFPREELYSLTDQIRRSSRSVSGNIAEGWRKRKYPKHFASTLAISDGEAAETQVWLDYALACKYIEKEEYEILYDKYDHIMAMLVTIISKREDWTY